MNRTCPHCHGANVRRSSKAAGEVTWHHQFLSPYRCRDCRTRFRVISRKTYIMSATILGAVLVTALAVFVLDCVLDSEDPKPNTGFSEAMPLSRPSVATFDTSPRTPS